VANRGSAFDYGRYFSFTLPHVVLSTPIWHIGLLVSQVN
jgi:hypothetical protein